MNKIISQIIFISLWFVSCGKPLDFFYTQVENYGYIPYVTPLKYAKTGTLIGGNPQKMSLVADPETCFPSEIDGEATNLRRRDETVLPYTRQVVEVDAKFMGKFSEVMQGVSPTVKGNVHVKNLKKMEVEFEGVHIEYIDSIALVDFYRNNMSETCKDYLQYVGFIVQAVVVDKMSFTFYEKNDTKLKIDAQKIEAFMDFGVDTKWHIEKESSLVIDTPKYIGYQIGSLTRKDQGLSLLRATSVRGKRWIFDKVDIYGGENNQSAEEYFGLVGVAEEPDGNAFHATLGEAEDNRVKKFYFGSKR